MPRRECRRSRRAGRIDTTCAPGGGCSPDATTNAARQANDQITFERLGGDSRQAEVAESDTGTITAFFAARRA